MSSHELKQKLTSLRGIERDIVPDVAWVQRTRETLLMQVKNSMPPAPVSWGARMTRLIESTIPSRFVSALRGPVLALISIFSLVLGGSMAGVSAAERSVPRDFLYPVKIATEQVRLAFTGDKNERLKLKTEFVGRRVDEIRTISASQDVSEKPERIKEAAENLKRDLNTVQKQLNEVTGQSMPQDVAAAAKLVDQQSTDATKALKTVKDQTPSSTADVQAKLSEAQVAAVTVGVQAVQVLVDHQGKSDTNVVTDAELLQSIHGKVQGVEESLAEATKQLVVAGVASSSMVVLTPNATSSLTLLPLSSSTAVALDTASSTALTQIKVAQEGLAQTKQLLVENKLGEVTGKLAESVKAVANAEAFANAAANATALNPASVAASSSLMTGSASGTLIVPAVAPSTPLNGSASGTAGLKSSTSSTASVSSTSVIPSAPSSTGRFGF